MPDDTPSGGDDPAPSALATVEGGLTIDKVREKLAPFLAANQASVIGEVDRPAGKRIAIEKPWGDDSLQILVPDEIDPLAEALNKLILPEPFSGLWHRDTKDLEFIWTAHPLGQSQQDVKGRSFLFTMGPAEYRCEFGRSSDRLLQIAGHAQPVTPSNTGFRNLFSIQAYVFIQAAKEEARENFPPVEEPLSFWIRNIEWSEEAILKLASHINFYMQYYDTLTPQILIHLPRSDVPAAQPQTRYRATKFPNRISARELDANMLQLWDGCHAGHAGQRFIGCYRLIEYAGVLYIETGAKAAVKKILVTPDVQDDPSGAMEQILVALQAQKLDKDGKIIGLLRETIDPKLLWREISKNLDYFAGPVVFDGGFTLPNLVTKASTEDTYGTQSITTFANYAKDIRNALSHGRDQRTSMVITPTKRNHDTLRPWASLMCVAAGEVMIYRNLL